ncbi:cytochrome c oxidase assembly protein [Salinarimonas rosea]|uniref:cytochrome c oxidase assembly protein n=1 Tax=Salinarimonas rosea TaxID=552063 RepID=UPI0005BC386E|nr:cytochrome c oxidase assembly protein [Salinarimonas rosea]
MSETYVPYCGPAPLPGEAGWNLDPVLLVAFAAAAIGYARAAGPGGASRAERAAFTAGLATLALAFVSPLCQLGVALFSARVGQHVLATLVAAPLMVWGRGGLALAGLAPRSRRDARGGGTSGGALALAPVAFALALWTWHLGPPYDATLTSDAIYWAMHLSLFGAALALWAAIIRAPARLSGAALLAAALTGLQMTLLGVALTFAEAPWFAAHLATTAPYGFTPLEDQQLGGLAMWMPGMVLLLANALLAFALMLRRVETRGAAG